MTTRYLSRVATFVVALGVTLGLAGATTRATAQPAAAPTAAAPAGASEPAAAAAAAATTPAPAAVPAPETWWDEMARRPYQHAGNFWMPPSASDASGRSDFMYYAVLGLSAFFFFGISIVVIGFVWKYRHRPGHKAEATASHNDAMEITWTVIPTLICVFLFLGGWRGYVKMTTPPKKALEVAVFAKKWEWNFVQPNGVEDNNLHVPVDTAVRLVMTSDDVLHSFFVPAFRIKQDLVPRRYTYTWFMATKPGVYRLYCTEYCGTDHSQMKRVVVVHDKGGYERYLADKKAQSDTLTGPELGAMLYKQKGCEACHSVDGSARIGPTFKGDFGSQAKLADGSTITVDENYLKESILAPMAKARVGYPPSMPAFEGQLSEKQLLGLVEYIKSLK